MGALATRGLVIWAERQQLGLNRGRKVEMRSGSLTGAKAAQSGWPRPIHQVSFWLDAG